MRSSDEALTATITAAIEASEAKDWRRAAALWDQLRATRPQDPTRWLRAGEAYSEARMLDEAERVLSEAVALFPRDRWIAYRHARVARLAGDWNEVVRRAGQLRETAPDFWPAWLDYADALAESGESLRAEAIRRLAAERFPFEYWPNYTVASLDAERSDPENALRVWSALCERFPGQPTASAALNAAREAVERPSPSATPAGRQSLDVTGPMALVVQCFNKPDTTQNLFDSLCKCEGHQGIDLIIWCDGLAGSRREVEFRPGRQAVLDLATAFARDRRAEFRSIEIHENPRNLGCYKTCQIAIDHALLTHDFVIFSEDDLIYSRDALLWFDAARAFNFPEPERIWAIAGESIFFDAGDKIPDQRFVEEILSFASERQLADKYVTLDFIPSSCFATSRARWAEFGQIRGRNRGDGEVARRCKREHRQCIFPVVPRAKDVGMLHEHGYSVTLKTKNGVEGVKGTYVLAENLLPKAPVGSLSLAPFESDSAALFHKTSQEPQSR